MGASKKMSQAMLDGCKKRKQVTGYVARNGGTCALGAALDGEYGLSEKEFTGRNENAYYKLIHDTWPVASIRVPCPCDNKKCHYKFGKTPQFDVNGVEIKDEVTGKIKVGYLTVMGLIPHLNDESRWTREKIAEWVAEMEKTLEPKVVNKLAHMSNKEILQEILGPEPVSASDLLKELLDRKEQITLPANKTH